MGRRALAVVAGMGLAGLFLLPPPALSAILGVPTNLNADGSTSGTTANPPGWFFLQGTAAAATGGDVVHQTRLFIEVTGTALDIQVFDPGNSDARDRLTGSTTTFELRDPCTPFPTCNGTIRAQILNLGNDRTAGNITDNRAVRLARRVTITTIIVNGPAVGDVRATTAQTHGLTVGDFVTVAGATVAQYNGTFAVSSVPSTTQFRYIPTSTGGADSTAGMTANAFYTRSTTTHASNDSFTGLTPGLYEFRITMGGSTSGNLFGVDIRDTNVANGTTVSGGNHYNVYTIGRTAVEDSAILIGVSNTGAPTAAITNRMFIYPYVTSGCSIATSNFDADAGAGIAGDITDVSSNVTALTMSGNGTHAENVVTVQSVTDASQTFASGNNLVSNNYGLYLLTNSLVSPGLNMVDWRVADFQGWSDNPAAAPRDPVNPMRMYLPNGYAGAVPPASNGTPPVEPILAVSASYVSGEDPPAPGGPVSTFTITASLDNPTGGSTITSDGTNFEVIVGMPSAVMSNATNFTCSIDGVDNTANCTATTPAAGAGFVARGMRLNNGQTLAAGSIFSFGFDVDFEPTASVLTSLTGSPADFVTNSNNGVRAVYRSAFNTDETLGPVCNLVVDVGNSAALVTRASITGLRVTPSGVVEFATGSQRNTLAFNIYGTSQADGLGSRTRLNASPIAAPVRNSLTPILYRVVTTGAITTSYIVIEELDAKGRRHFMGPYAVDDQRLKDAFGRIEARLAGVGTKDRRNARIVPPKSHHRLAGDRRAGHRGRGAGQHSSHGIKIEVSQAGMVQVPLSDLYAQGLPAGFGRNSGHLRLTNRGHEVEFSLSDAALTFQARELSTDYTGRNVYVLTWGGHDAPAPSVRLTRSEDPKKPGTVRVQENWLYYPTAPQGSDPWLWDLLFAEEPGWPYPFDVPGLIPGTGGDVKVRIRLLGDSSHTHTVQAAINGITVGSVTFTGTASSLLKGRIPAGMLASSGNVLSFAYTASGGGPEEPGQVYFDYVDLDAPVDRSSVSVAVDQVSGYDPRLPAVDGADYLIITHAFFRDQAERIAAQKRRDGLRPAIVDVDRAYDRYTAGIFEANAIRQLVREIGGRTRLRFVLLIGDDTFDYRDYSVTGQVSYIPSLYGWDGEFGRVASENLYADLNGDGAPDLAIGRLPVQTPEEADVLVYKISRQASVLGALRGRYLFALDNQGPGDISFVGEAQAVINVLPPGSQVTLANLASGLDGARQMLLQGLQQGQLITSYFGHGGPQIWADEHLLTLDDMAGLANTFRETVLFTWGCEAQFFQYLFGPSISEALLLVPGGGALASFGPAGITDPDLQRVLSTKVYDKFLGEGLALGEAIRHAKAEALAANPATKGVIEGWNLLGDPSLRLPDGPRARPRRGLP